MCLIKQSFNQTRGVTEPDMSNGLSLHTRSVHTESTQSLSKKLTFVLEFKITEGPLCNFHFTYHQ